MKKITISLVSIAWIFSFLFCLFSCADSEPQNASPDFSEEEDAVYEEMLDYSRYFRDMMAMAPALREVPVSALCMLGSHDAFTDKINMDSALDTANQSFLTNADLVELLKGAYVKFAKAQADDVYVQLVSGVRYIDMRVSAIEEEFYNCHTLISDTLRNGLLLLLQFLEENSGEFFIVNIHKYYADDKDMSKLDAYMREVRYNGKNIFDYVRYDRSEKDFSTLTYNDVTENGSKSGVVLFSNASGSCESEHPVFSQFSRYTYMPGPVSIESPKVIAATVKNIPTALAKGTQYLRVCQAQTIPQSDEIWETISSLSLLDKAMEHNDFFLQSESFDEILNAFPIMEFDYTTYNETGFVDGILEKMLQKNLSLVA